MDIETVNEWLQRGEVTACVDIMQGKRSSCPYQESIAAHIWAIGYENFRLRQDLTLCRSTLKAIVQSYDHIYGSGNGVGSESFEVLGEK